MEKQFSNFKEDLNQAWAVFEQLIKSDYGSYGLVYGLQDGILWYTITKNVFGEVAVLNDENSVSSVSLAQCIYMACEKWLNS